MSGSSRPSALKKPAQTSSQKGAVMDPLLGSPCLEAPVKKQAVDGNCVSAGSSSEVGGLPELKPFPAKSWDEEAEEKKKKEEEREEEQRQKEKEDGGKGMV